jgi:hypothetical protein
MLPISVECYCSLSGLSTSCCKQTTLFILQGKASAKSMMKRGRDLLGFSSDEDHVEDEGEPAVTCCADASPTAYDTTEVNGGKSPRKARKIVDM